MRLKALLRSLFSSLFNNITCFYSPWSSKENRLSCVNFHKGSFNESCNYRYPIGVSFIRDKLLKNGLNNESGVCIFLGIKYLFLSKQLNFLAYFVYICTNNGLKFVKLLNLKPYCTSVIWTTSTYCCRCSCSILNLIFSRWNMPRNCFEHFTNIESSSIRMI